MSRPYKPSSGTEGTMFDSEWCAKCQKDYTYRRTGKGPGCGIIVHALSEDAPPKEWVEDEGGPRCLSFQPIKPKELRKKKKKKVDPNQMKLF